MKIVFNNDFFRDDYSDDPSASKKRMESIFNEIKMQNGYELIDCLPADEIEILAIHTPEYIESIRKNHSLYKSAVLSAGGAIKAAQISFAGEPAFACIKPPGHHAYKSSGWGYCYFSNMAIALTKLRNEGKIKSAFVIDIDAHTGDGTINCLKEWKECYIFNPMADDNKSYIKKIEDYLKNLPYVDIIGVCAGFDAYKKDLGKKLERFDFYIIGRLISILAKKMGHHRRFATLEGGYYLPDLGKNVVSFCEGLKSKSL